MQAFNLEDTITQTRLSFIGETVAHAEVIDPGEGGVQLQQGWIFVTALGELVAYSDTLYLDDCEYGQIFQARS